MDEIDRIEDGTLLKQIRGTSSFAALERLLKRMRDDVMEDFAKNEASSRKEVRGKLAILDEIVPKIDDMIRDSEELLQMENENLEVARGKALEGGGSGDLAL